MFCELRSIFFESRKVIITHHYLNFKNFDFGLRNKSYTSSAVHFIDRIRSIKKNNPNKTTEVVLCDQKKKLSRLKVRFSKSQA